MTNFIRNLAKSVSSEHPRRLRLSSIVSPLLPLSESNLCLSLHFSQISQNFWEFLSFSQISQGLHIAKFLEKYFSFFLKFLTFLKISQISQISQNFFFTKFLYFHEISQFFSNFSLFHELPEKLKENYYQTFCIKHYCSLLLMTEIDIYFINSTKKVWHLRQLG
jgi:hypothetical protein